MFSNLAGRIGADRERIASIKARQDRTTQAEASGGVVIDGDGGYVRVTFAEKPARAILDALKAAGYRWSHGSWIGERSKLPLCTDPRHATACLKGCSACTGEGCEVQVVRICAYCGAASNGDTEECLDCGESLS